MRLLSGNLESRSLDARRLGRRLLVDYEAPDGEPVSLVVNLNPPHEKRVPPRTFTFEVAGRRKGVFVVEYAALEPDVEYEVKITVSDAEAKPLARRAVTVGAEQPGALSRAAGEVRLAGFFLSDRVRRLFRR